MELAHIFASLVFLLSVLATSPSLGYYSSQSQSGGLQYAQRPGSSQRGGGRSRGGGSRSRGNRRSNRRRCRARGNCRGGTGGQTDITVGGGGSGGSGLGNTNGLLIPRMKPYVRGEPRDPFDENQFVGSAFTMYY